MITTKLLKTSVEYNKNWREDYRKWYKERWVDKTTFQKLKLIVALPGAIFYVVCVFFLVCFLLPFIALGGFV